MWTIKQCFLRLVPACAEISCCLLSAAAGFTLQFPCDQSHSSGKENGHLSPNITSVRLLLINLYARSTATKSCHRGVSRRSNCPDAAILSYTFILLFTGEKKQVLKITRKVIFAVAQSGQITAQVGWRISAVLRGGRESVNGAEQKCFYKHERLRTCWPSQEWFTSVVPKEKQPQLTLFFFFLFFAKSQTPTVSNKKIMIVKQLNLKDCIVWLLADVTQWCDCILTK